MQKVGNLLLPDVERQGKQILQNLLKLGAEKGGEARSYPQKVFQRCEAAGKWHKYNFVSDVKWPDLTCK